MQFEVKLRAHRDRSRVRNTDDRIDSTMELQQPETFERYLRPIFDSMFEGIQILDTDWRYVYLNATAAQQGRRTREELIGQRIMDAYPGIDQTGMFDRLRRCMVERTPQHMLNEFAYPDGATAWFNLRMNPVPMGVLVLSIDVTAEKIAEEQFREAQKLEAIGRLAGGVAHDFNNLLTVITGYSELVLRGIADDDPYRTEIEEISSASQSAAALTRQLLMFSRRQRLRPEPIDLNDVVEQMDRMLRRVIGADIDLVTHMRPGIGAVLFDRSHIEQIIMNLAVNARDAMPYGGKLTIETGRVELDASYVRMHPEARTGAHVMLAVSDTGTGMDAATKARIFEPFFTTKERGKGTGLGLATVYGIVKQSGGNIWVYSEPGRGTIFKVYLPVVDEPASGPTPAAHSATVATVCSETIMVVEDDPGVRGYVRNMLQAAGYTVLDAGHPDEALDLVQRYDGRIHLLLTDVMLPMLDGRELARRLVELRPDLRVVFMSGYTDDAILHRGLLDSDTAFVDKPIAADALLATLREMLERPQ